MLCNKFMLHLIFNKLKESVRKQQSQIYDRFSFKMKNHFLLINFQPKTMIFDGKIDNLRRNYFKIFFGDSENISPSCESSDGDV